MRICRGQSYFMAHDYFDNILINSSKSLTHNRDCDAICFKITNLMGFSVRRNLFTISLSETFNCLIKN